MGPANGESGPEPERFDPKVEEAILGREAEVFIEEHPIGQYLIDRAKADLARAQEALLEIDPSDAKAIFAAQLDARVANRVRGWIAEAIENGRQARALIREERSENAD